MAEPTVERRALQRIATLRHTDARDKMPFCPRCEARRALGLNDDHEATDVIVEDEWQRVAKAVRELGGEANIRQVAAHLGVHESTAGPALHGAVQSGLLTEERVWRSWVFKTVRTPAGSASKGEPHDAPVCPRCGGHPLHLRDGAQALCPGGRDV